MENLLILLLFLALPRIIKAVAKQGQSGDAKQRPARERPRRADRPAPPVEDTPEEAAEVQLPPWLESLAERLGAPKDAPTAKPLPPQRGPGVPDPEAPPPWHDVAAEPRFEREGMTNYEGQPPITSMPVTPGPEWQRATEALRQVTGKRRQQRMAGAPGASPSVPLPRGPRPVTAMPRGRQGWRRAIVLAEVLGAPRALKPYEGPDSVR